MANAWTPERRARQRALIASLKPWTRATGPRTVAGKTASAGNARKHGGRSRVHFFGHRQIRNYIRVCRLAERVIRHSLPHGGPSSDELSLLERLTDDAFDILHARLTGQIIPGAPQKNSRVSSNEVLANEASAKESLEILRGGLTKQIIRRGPQKNSQVSTDELLAEQPLAKESLAKVPWNSRNGAWLSKSSPAARKKIREFLPTDYWLAKNRPRNHWPTNHGTAAAAA